MGKYLEIAFTPEVIEAQEQYGGRRSAARMAASDHDDQHLSKRETEFIGARDGFYMASANSDGWPYVQFRGGPIGFVHTLDKSTLAFADYRGNLQNVSVGNVRGDGRVSLFFMDYAHRRRLKVFARAEILDPSGHEDLARQLGSADVKAKVERIFVLKVVAFDWNCPQHITPRWSEAELVAMAEAANR